MESESVGSSSVSVQCDGDMVTNPVHHWSNRSLSSDQLERNDYNTKVAPFSPRNTPDALCSTCSLQCDKKDCSDDSDQDAIVTLSEGEEEEKEEEKEEDNEETSISSTLMKHFQLAVRV